MMNAQRTDADIDRPPSHLPWIGNPLAWVARTRSLVRVFFLMVATCSCWPASATAILDESLLASGDPAVVGWTNGAGNFILDKGGDGLSGPGRIGYSTASSLLSYQSNSASFFVDETISTGLVPVDLQFNVLVEGNGTMTGNLLGGLLTARAGAQGIPQLGAAPGETLFLGLAIDSAAPPSAYSPALLFDITYTINSLSSFADYLTFVGAQQLFFNAGGYHPWGVGDGSMGSGGFTFDDFVSTHKVPEPATCLIMLVGLAVAGLAARWRKAN
jgi:hypothetical protein